MKHRTVVANFLFRWSNPEKTQQQVALFRRSHHPNIRSYQGKYSPISGSIEAEDLNPILAAHREIQEETQLTPDRDITLEFCGQSYSFEDHQAGRSWVIYPFGWIVNVPDERIKIDWEHDSWAWFDPQELLNGSMDDECVPRLDDSLRRVFFGPNGMFKNGGELVTRDNAAGIKFLETIDSLKHVSNDSDSDGTPELNALQGLHSIAQIFKNDPTEGPASRKYLDALTTAAHHLAYSTKQTTPEKIHAFLATALQKVTDTMENDELDLAVVCNVLKTYMTRDVARTD